MLMHFFFSKGKTSRPARRTQLQVEALEDRMVPFVFGSVVAAPASQLAGVYVEPSPLPPPVTMPPALSSNPGAFAKLYLDFDGHSEPGWFGHPDAATPVFDLDGNPLIFS